MTVVGLSELMWFKHENMVKCVCVVLMQWEWGGVCVCVCGGGGGGLTMGGHLEGGRQSCYLVRGLFVLVTDSKIPCRADC